MITQQKDGSLYCNRCKRTCDDTCYSSCEWYKRSCTTCTHWFDESGYCDDCTILVNNRKWEDRYEH